MLNIIYTFKNIIIYNNIIIIIIFIYIKFNMKLINFIIHIERSFISSFEIWN